MDLILKKRIILIAFRALLPKSYQNYPFSNKWSMNRERTWETCRKGVDSIFWWVKAKEGGLQTKRDNFRNFVHEGGRYFLSPPIVGNPDSNTACLKDELFIFMMNVYCSFQKSVSCCCFFVLSQTQNLFLNLPVAYADLMILISKVSSRVFFKIVFGNICFY